MTLSAEQRAAYGKGWPALSAWIRFERSGGQCECEGECGWLPHLTAQALTAQPVTVDDAGEPDAPWEPLVPRCQALNREPSPYTGSRVVLTAAHLDRDGHTGQHDPDRIKAMCNGCHLAYDRQAR